MAEMKVAIVNRTNLLNYGSVLQVLGLAEIVKQLGFEVDVVWERGSVVSHLDLRPRKIFSIGLKMITHPKLMSGVFKDVHGLSKIVISEETKLKFSKFVERNFTRRLLSSKEMRKIGKNNEYHRFVCGSDQVWCSTTLYPDPLMYLRFAKREKRVAYAPSFGRNYIPKYNKRQIKRWINDIPYVSVRELEGAKLIKQLTGRSVDVVLDPTLLFKSSFWMQYAQPINESKYELCYFLDEPSENIQNSIVGKSNGKKIVALGRHLTKIKNSNIIYPEAGPGEFLSYIANADFIYTDSYHGMLFALNYNKKFLSIERNYSEFDQSTRQKSILSQLGLLDRYVINIGKDYEEIDYELVNKRLAELRDKSIRFLSKSF